MIRRAEEGEDIRIARYRGPTFVRLVADTPKPDPKRRVDWKEGLANLAGCLPTLGLADRHGDDA